MSILGFVGHSNTHKDSVPSLWKVAESGHWPLFSWPRKWPLVIHVSQHWHRVPRTPRTEFPIIFTSRHLWTFSTVWKYKNYSKLLVCSLPSWTSSLSNCPLGILGCAWGIARSGARLVLSTHKSQPPLHLQLSSNQASRSSHKRKQAAGLPSEKVN